MSQVLANSSAVPFGEALGGPYLTDDALTALAQRPGFDAAMLSAATSVVELYRGNWWLNRLVNDRGRAMLGLMIVDLHCDPVDGPGFTPARLQEIAGAVSLCSPGRITAFLATLRLLGYLRPITSDDRRLRRLIPTQPFLGAHKERWQQILAALSTIHPDAANASVALDDTAFIGGFVRVLVGAYRDGLRIAQFVPELLTVADRDAGLTMMLSLLVADAAGQSVSIAALARRFSVSRAHVLTVLREAERAGLTVAVGPRGGYRASPALAGKLRRFFSVVFLLYLAAIDSGRRASGMAA